MAGSVLHPWLKNTLPPSLEQILTLVQLSAPGSGSLSRWWSHCVQDCVLIWSHPILSSMATAGLFPGRVVLSKGLTVARQMDGSVGMSKGSLRIPTTNPTNEDLQLLPYLFAVR